MVALIVIVSFFIIFFSTVFAVVGMSSFHEVTFSVHARGDRT